MNPTERRRERAGRREANLRLLNERIARAHDSVDPSAEFELMITCECARTDCNEMIAIARDHFSTLNERVDRFAVVRGHVVADVERVVEDHGDWQVVEKFGAAADAAASALE